MSIAPPVPPALQAHADELNQAEVIKVTDHIYVAYGYALANMIMIEGTDGIIIVDTTESGDVALFILNEFRKITSKPIKAIIHTHFHSDHIYGASALLETCGDDKDEVMVIAHSSQYAQITQATLTADAVTIGAAYQFGLLLEQGTERVCCGIGPFLAPYSEEVKREIVKPTHTFDDEAEYDIAGIKLKLYHTPGETDDQITVWIPEWKVVMPADNIYKTFPNLYAIRGSPPRDCVKWYTSLDFVKRLNAKHMVMSHTRPVTGAGQIRSIITSYRDAIQFIHDQTLRFLNQGMEIDDIVEKVQLPECLASHPYLQQFYGMVSWSVRSVVAGQIGWFDRNPIRLFPLSFGTKAQNLDQLLSKEFASGSAGAEKLLITAEETLALLKTQPDLDSKTVEMKATWSLELSLQAINLTAAGSALNQRAIGDATVSLSILAGNTINPNARNFFLTSLKDLYQENLVPNIVRERRLLEIPKWPVEIIMKWLCLNYKAENVSESKRKTIVIKFPDVNQAHSYVMRHKIIEHQDDPNLVEKVYNVKATMSSTVWKELLVGTKTLEAAVESGEVQIEGKRRVLARFLSLIEI